MGRVIHRKKFQDGRISPIELHQAYAFEPGAKCQGCGAPPLISILMFAEEKEMVRRDPMLTVLAKNNPEAYMSMVVRTKRGSFMRVSKVYACARCQPEAERAAAKHPDWMFAQIDRGPAPDRLVVGMST